MSRGTAALGEGRGRRDILCGEDIAEEDLFDI